MFLVVIFKWFRLGELLGEQMAFFGPDYDKRERERPRSGIVFIFLTYHSWRSVPSG